MSGGSPVWLRGVGRGQALVDEGGGMGRVLFNVLVDHQYETYSITTNIYEILSSTV